MEPASLIPAVEAIPVHWLWFKILLLLTFFLHILFMNVLLGGSVLAFLGHLGSKKDHWECNDLSHRLPVVTSMTINLGVAPLLFLQVLYGGFVYVSSVLSAVYWLGVIAFLILAYYGLYLYRYRYETLDGGRTVVMGLVVVLLLVVAFVFTNNMTLMLEPKHWTAYFKNPFGSLVNWSEPSLIPRYLHFVTASLAVGGLYLALTARYKAARGDIAAEKAVTTGMNYFNWATVVQTGIGLWLLISLPQEIMLGFLGGNGYATVLLFIALAGAAGALIFGFKNMPGPAAGFLLLTVAGMVLMRDAVRDAFLKPYHSLASIPVTGQAGPLVLFLVTFVVGLAIVGYMFKIYYSARKVG